MVQEVSSLQVYLSTCSALLLMYGQGIKTRIHLQSTNVLIVVSAHSINMAILYIIDATYSTIGMAIGLYFDV